VSDSCVGLHGSEASDFIKVAQFLHCLSICHVLEKDSASWS
jgi:hypothetical protein